MTIKLKKEDRRSLKSMILLICISLFCMSFDGCGGDDEDDDYDDSTDTDTDAFIYHLNKDGTAIS